MLSHSARKPKRIVIANAKGGCGKTTIATNLAAYIASQNLNTVLIDQDSQGSSMLWLKNRPTSKPKITGISAHVDLANKITKSWQMRIPLDTQFIIVDTPASIGGFSLRDLARTADLIIVPVLPSPIDMDAATTFINTLKDTVRNVIPKINIGAVANRVRRNSNSFKLLYEFLLNTGVPYLGALRDTLNYAKAAQDGLSVHELNISSVGKDISQWENIMSWLQPTLHSPQKNFDLSAEARVVNCA